MIVAVIPAHNEQASIANTVRSLYQQVGVVYVAADNCADNTVQVAEDAGAIVFETVDNTHKKAGALNQILSQLIPYLDTTDYIFAADADTIISDTFVTRAMSEFSDPLVGAVGGVFFGSPSNLIERIQSNEYVRYARQISQTGRTMVLSGTAVIIRVSALNDVASARGNLLPGNSGDYYDSSALTEDMEIGLALKTCGWKLKSPTECSCTTELMPNRKALINQRVRWYRGAIENLLSYGLTRVTARYWLQQVMLSIVTVGFAVYLLYTAAVITLDGLTFSYFWAAIGLIFMTERVVTSWRSGWYGRLIAVSMLPELIYDMILQSAYVRAVWKTFTKADSVWLHEGGRNV